MFCIFAPNLVILVWTGPRLLRGQQVIDTQTHRQTQATATPEGQNWPRGTMSIIIENNDNTNDNTTTTTTTNDTNII